ncbi:hypothetical protein B0I35DRAFT_441096 [Stachybotrys elegans]|uniref:Uncharacterized protein n=1 Tax=Stachybotrys elegans TaxID=80388 RepID=A0A8K0WLL0_9HYPO|nr:hypothetical protein B0I35DRAFT_441096 [Stachybotrys elegans]
MSVINFAYTAPVNPSGASPVLDEAQVWAGLKRKVRRAYEFVPIITGCEVISEEGTTVVREATFQGRPSPVREVCEHYEPSRIDFRQPDGAVISNIVSRGSDDALHMTYVFEVRRPDLGEGSEEATDFKREFSKMAKVAVEGSIETIRRLVKEGEI